jgi:hypothetical protein
VIPSHRPTARDAASLSGLGWDDPTLEDDGYWRWRHADYPVAVCYDSREYACWALAIPCSCDRGGHALFARHLIDLLCFVALSRWA